MYDSIGKSFVSAYDRLKKWSTRSDGCYCPVDILSINTSFRLGPAKDSSRPLGDRQYDYYYIYALLNESTQEIKGEVSRSRMEYAHPHDKAFWQEALDWFEVGNVHDNGTLCHLYYEVMLPSHNEKELRSEIEQLEQYFREQRPNGVLEFNKPINSGTGCYVATAVYGSYDCPEVWTLRRFRDQRLAETFLGRAFIRFYYAVSPTVVRYFGKTTAFNRFFRKRLDRLVERLQQEGIESAPYRDK